VTGVDIPGRVADFVLLAARRGSAPVEALA
jgi:hypothetical protein